jgi:hypothetical protein
MSERSRRQAFAARPGDAESWVKAAETAKTASAHSARLTIDVTPELRGRIKVAAFRRGVTVADMLRAMLVQAFPGDDGGTS